MSFVITGIALETSLINEANQDGEISPLIAITALKGVDPTQDQIQAAFIKQFAGGHSPEIEKLVSTLFAKANNLETLQAQRIKEIQLFYDRFVTIVTNLLSQQSIDKPKGSKKKKTEESKEVEKPTEAIVELSTEKLFYFKTQQPTLNMMKLAFTDDLPVESFVIYSSSGHPILSISDASENDTSDIDNEDTQQPKPTKLQGIIKQAITDTINTLTDDATAKLLKRAATPKGGGAAPPSA
ncbi:MAG: hypothetical protein AAGB32_03600 [Pseudomonadota bacterium]